MPLKNLGLAPAGLPIRSRAGRGGAIKYDYIEHCHNLGVGVVETRAIAPEEAQSFRKKMEAYHMRAIGERAAAARRGGPRAVRFADQSRPRRPASSAFTPR